MQDRNPTKMLCVCKVIAGSIPALEVAKDSITSLIINYHNNKTENTTSLCETTATRVLSCIALKALYFSIF